MIYKALSWFFWKPSPISEDISALRTTDFWPPPHISPDAISAVQNIFCTSIVHPLTIILIGNYQISLDELQIRLLAQRPGTHLNTRSSTSTICFRPSEIFSLHVISIPYDVFNTNKQLSAPPSARNRIEQLAVTHCWILTGKLLHQPKA